MMGLSRGVCLLCQKCMLIFLVLKTCLKFCLCLVLSETFQYSDLDAPGCLSYPVVQPSVWSRDYLRKIISNMVISKLRGVCRTQLREHLCGLEIIWQFKMSKLLNLSAYSLLCLLPCTNWDISCICQCLAKHVSQIIVAHFEMISIFYIHACLAWYWSPYACGDFAQIATSLNFISISLLHVCYLLLVYLWGLTLIFFFKMMASWGV
jgi:hypothetical protein